MPGYSSLLMNSDVLSVVCLRLGFMTIKTIKSFYVPRNNGVPTSASRKLKTEIEIVVLLEGDEVRFAPLEGGGGS
ncbi:hypothetical protein [Anaplasma bovis]|uniref:hypothetical protein n=1 Tax=Anaplasma bovis TaxID=186733 RepID=UPI002FF41CA1